MTPDSEVRYATAEPAPQCFPLRAAPVAHPLFFYRSALTWIRQGKRFALATLVRTSGSTPQKVGAKALFDTCGQIIGTLGGGCLEAEIRKRSLDALDLGAPLLADIRLDSLQGWDDGLLCGGKVTVFVDPQPERWHEVFEKVVNALETSTEGVLLVHVKANGSLSGKVEWVPGDALTVDHASSFCLGECLDFLRDTLASLLAEGVPRLVELEDETQERVFFADPLPPAPKLIIAGGGYIGHAVAQLARFVGFEVTLIDDRPTFASPNPLPVADHYICGDIARETAARATGKNTFLVVVTRGHRHDFETLAACIHAPLRYIGVIGSRRKALVMKKQMLEQGICTEAEWARIHTPIGLNLGAKTVEEIALSIVAELVRVYRCPSGTAGPLHLRDTLL